MLDEKHIFCQVDFVNVKPSIVCKSEIAFEHLWIVDPFALKLILKFFIKSVEINRHLPILKALCKQDALNVLELYYRLEITVLGGDVLCLNDDGTIHYVSDGWYSDPIEGENEKEYFLRSIDESRRYITNYTHPFINSSSILFDIVTNCQDIQ